MEYKDFFEAMNSNETFFQVMFYDRRKEYDGFLESRTFSTLEEAKRAINEMKTENEEMFQKMLKTYEKYGITEENYRDNEKWNSLVDNPEIAKLIPEERYLFRYTNRSVGLCFIKLYERNIAKEIEKEILL